MESITLEKLKEKKNELEQSTLIIQNDEKIFTVERELLKYCLNSTSDAEDIRYYKYLDGFYKSKTVESQRLIESNNKELEATNRRIELVNGAIKLYKLNNKIEQF